MVKPCLINHFPKKPKKKLNIFIFRFSFFFLIPKCTDNPVIATAQSRSLSGLGVRGLAPELLRSILALSLFTIYYSLILVSCLHELNTGGVARWFQPVDQDTWLNYIVNLLPSLIPPHPDLVYSIDFDTQHTHSPCIAQTVIHTLQAQGAMARAVPLAPMPTLTRTGPRSPTLLSGAVSRIALPSATIVSSPHHQQLLHFGTSTG
jgi:hypothetical protein